MSETISGTAEAVPATTSPMSRLAHQVGFDLLIFRRNPAATFFTIVLPLIFLVLFTSIFGNETISGDVKLATFYVPGVLALAIISATAVNLAISMTARRERGMLKRLRGTPIPQWVFVVSQGLAGFIISVVMTVLIVVMGRLLFGVSVQMSGLPSLVVTLLVGSTAFVAIGLALTTIITSEDAAPAVTNAVMLPLYFISDVFIVGDQTPSWVQTVGNLFPVRHLSLALRQSFDPFVEGTPFPWDHWLVIGGWGAVSAIITLRWFRWTHRR